MLSIWRPFSTRGLLANPLTRTAMLMFVWNHRHEVFRWGRSLWDQFIGRGNIGPVPAVRTGMLLFAIASEAEFRDAKQLRKVTMVDDIVDLDVDPTWAAIPRLVAKVRSVKGVAHVTVNGTSVDAGVVVPSVARSV